MDMDLRDMQRCRLDVPPDYEHHYEATVPTVRRPWVHAHMTHRWHWRKYLPERHGHLCRVLAVGRMNSALVEFEDGTKVVTSRYAVRKLIHNAELTGRAAGEGPR